MTREVVARKLGRLRTLLADLEPHRGKSVDEVLEDDDIDYEIVAASIDRALTDFDALVRLYAQRLAEEPS